MPNRPNVIRLLTRVTAAEGETVFFTVDGLSGSAGNSRHTIIQPENVPAFEGHEGWFELERVSAKPWSYWRAVRPAEPPPGWVPSPPPRKKHPSELLGPR